MNYKFTKAPPEGPTTIYRISPVDHNRFYVIERPNPTKNPGTWSMVDKFGSIPTGNDQEYGLYDTFEQAKIRCLKFISDDIESKAKVQKSWYPVKKDSHDKAPIDPVSPDSGGSQSDFVHEQRYSTMGYEVTVEVSSSNEEAMKFVRDELLLRGLFVKKQKTLNDLFAEEMKRGFRGQPAVAPFATHQTEPMSVPDGTYPVLDLAEEQRILIDPAHDPVNRPAHYTDGKIEVIDFIIDKNLPYCLGNVVKYISRAGKKDPGKHLEDLRKAAWYLNHQIELEEERLNP